MLLVSTKMVMTMMTELSLKREQIWWRTEMIKKAAQLGSFLLTKFLKPFPQCFQIRAQPKN